MVGIRFVLSPLKEGSADLQREGGGGEGREGEVELQHVSSLPVLGRLIVLVEDSGCKGEDMGVSY